MYHPLLCDYRQIELIGGDFVHIEAGLGKARILNVMGVMPSRLTIEVAQEAARKKGGLCVSDTYKSGVSLRWECAAGHRWNAGINSVKNSNSWCPKCSGKRRDADDLKVAAASRGGEWLGVTYQGMQIKTLWKCANGHEWKTTPAIILTAGAWCPQCSTGLGERLVRSAFEQICGVTFPKFRPAWLRNDDGWMMEFDGFNESLGLAFEHQGRQHYELNYFTKSVSSLAKRIKDDSRKRRLAKLENVRLVEVPEVGAVLKLVDLEQFIRLAVSTLAPDVAQSSAHVDYLPAYLANGAGEMLERMKKLAESNGGECIATAYKGSRSHHEFRCAAGHVWGAASGTIFSGKWCPFCSAARKASKARLPIEELRAFALSKGGRLISEVYRAQKEKQEWECARGHRWFAKYNSIKAGKWCPTCAKWTLAEMEELAKSRGGKVISREYKAVAIHLEWECSKGHRWLAKPNNVLNGNWCPHCARNRKLDIEDMKTLAASKGGTCLSKDYINAKTKMDWMCSKGHRWSAVPHAVKSGHWCPFCAGVRR